MLLPTVPRNGPLSTGWSFFTGRQKPDRSEWSVKDRRGLAVYPFEPSRPPVCRVSGKDRRAGGAHFDLSTKYLNVKILDVKQITEVFADGCDR